MKQLFVRTALCGCMVVLLSCEKEVQEETNQEAPEIVETRAQSGECEKKPIIYREYIDCTKEGTGCKVECDTYASADASLLGYLASLDPTENNTQSLKDYLSTLPYISIDVYNEIQEATALYLRITEHDGTTVYGIFNESDELVYAFSFDA